MFKKILCPLDGSEHAGKALALAIDLAKANGAGLVLVHALLRGANADELQHFAEVEGLTKSVEPAVQWLRSLEGRLDYGYKDEALSSRAFVEIGQKVLDGAKEDAREAGVGNVETELVSGDPAALILDCIDKHGVDCVVLGSRGLSDVKSLFLGSVSHKVANHAPCTCIAVK